MGPLSLQGLPSSVPAVLGHTARKDEEVDRMEGASSSAKLIEQESRASGEGGGLSGLLSEFLSLGGFMGSFGELS